MRVICVDDERLIMEHTVSMCRELPQIDEVQGFVRCKDALEYLSKHTVALCLLDIDMPDMNGIQLAARIKQVQPEAAILFLTGYSQYAVDAFRVHASGYLLKPVSKDRLFEEVAYVLSGRKEISTSHIRVQTFGDFDIYVDGRLIGFNRSRAKELLAYLIDRRGSAVSRGEAFAALYGDTLYDRSMQKQFDVIIRSLKETLEAYEIGKIFEMNRGTMRIHPELLDCDLYRFLEGDIKAVNSYRGEYMSAYEWSNPKEGYLTAHKESEIIQDKYETELNQNPIEGMIPDGSEG